MFCNVTAYAMLALVYYFTFLLAPFVHKKNVTQNLY